MFALAGLGDVMGEQLLQTRIWYVCIMEPLSHAVKVLKLAKQITLLMGTDTTTLAPVDADVLAQEVGKIETLYGM
jgi:hypothetical protein